MRLWTIQCDNLKETKSGFLYRDEYERVAPEDEKFIVPFKAESDTIKNKAPIYTFSKMSGERELKFNALAKSYRAFTSIAGLSSEVKEPCKKRFLYELEVPESFILSTKNILREDNTEVAYENHAEYIKNAPLESIMESLIPYIERGSIVTISEITKSGHVGGHRIQNVYSNSKYTSDLPSVIHILPCDKYGIEVNGKLEVMYTVDL